MCVQAFFKIKTIICPAIFKTQVCSQCNPKLFFYIICFFASIALCNRYSDHLQVCRKFARNLKRSRKGNLSHEKQVKKFAHRMKEQNEGFAKRRRLSAIKALAVKERKLVINKKRSAMAFEKRKLAREAKGAAPK